jgi:hypothetical protein
MKKARYSSNQLHGKPALPTPGTQSTLHRYFSTSDTSSTKRKFDHVDSAADDSPSSRTVKHTKTIVPSTPAPSKAETHQPEDHSCDRCNKIDLNDAFKIHSGLGGRLIIPLKITSDMKESACSLCRLFFAVHVPDGPENSLSGQGHHLRAFNEYALYSLKQKKKGLHADVRVLLAVAPGRPYKWQLRERRLCFAQGLIAPTSSSFSSQRVLRALMIKPAAANFDLVRRWLSTCETRHQETCWLKDFHRPTPLRCIDCYTGRIVKIGKDKKYVALSYVWGESKKNRAPEKMKNRTSLRYLPVPQVIEDAIIVVKELGLRYLWADKFCIN